MTLSNIDLTANSIWQPLLDAELDFGASLFGAGGLIPGLNGGGGAYADFTGLLGVEREISGAVYQLVKNLPLEDMGTSGQNVLNGTFSRLFDAVNMFLSGNEQAFMGLLGIGSNPAALSPLALTNTLLADAANPNNLFHSGDIGGLQNVAAAIPYAFGNLKGIINDNLGFNLVPGPEKADFAALQDAFSTFDRALVSGQLAFNDNLVTSQLGIEKALFGTDNALNGIVNRGFNALNMLLDAQQQSLNGLLGISYSGYSPLELTNSLMFTPYIADAPLNDGTIGGLMGAFNQTLSMFTNLAGLVLDPSTFNIDFGAINLLNVFPALFGAFDVSAFGPAFDALGPVGTDLGAILLSFIGI
ncbi:hypothetical protein B8W67_13440 [Mycolicibacillus koreensis]|uniref:PE family protein n=1 Tax=Mycolicibacillus koreensis TaxID=1069220 RepID=A0AA91PDX4_9MYCO|nr:hypothetical protein B8W67_13440 [Mycolicibacillus koreensis]